MVMSISLDVINELLMLHNRLHRPSTFSVGVKYLKHLAHKSLYWWKIGSKVGQGTPDLDYIVDIVKSRLSDVHGLIKS